MSDRIKLLETAVKKVSTDDDFIAYHLENYKKRHNKSNNEVMKHFSCDEEKYQLLLLCKAPLNKGNPITPVNEINADKIASYIGVDVKKLIDILKMSLEENNMSRV